MEFGEYARIKLQDAIVFSHPRLLLHIHKKKIAKGSIIAAVEDKSCFALDLRPAHHTLCRVLHLIKNSIGGNKPQGKEIQIRKALHIMHFDDSEKISIALHPERDHFVDPHFADDLGLTAKPPAFFHKGLQNFSFKHADFMVVGKY